MNNNGETSFNVFGHALHYNPAHVWRPRNRSGVAAVGIIARFGIEGDLVRILQHETSSIACDCGAVARDATHPRYHGTYPRVLGRYVREQQALTWEDAIRKMTGLPAATTGLVDRGLLAAGMAADVTVFDPATVIDHATFDEPTRPSAGSRRDRRVSSST